MKDIELYGLDKKLTLLVNRWSVNNCKPYQILLDTWKIL